MVARPSSYGSPGFSSMMGDHRHRSGPGADRGLVGPVGLVVDLHPEAIAHVRAVEAAEAVVEVVAARGVRMDRLLDRVPEVGPLLDLQLDQLPGRRDPRAVVEDPAAKADPPAGAHAPSR